MYFAQQGDSHDQLNPLGNLVSLSRKIPITWIHLKTCGTMVNVIKPSKYLSSAETNGAFKKIMS